MTFFFIEVCPGPVVLDFNVCDTGMVNIYTAEIQGRGGSLRGRMKNIATAASRAAIDVVLLHLIPSLTPACWGVRRDELK